jgi:hypothetical protein
MGSLPQFPCLSGQKRDGQNTQLNMPIANWEVPIIFRFFYILAKKEIIRLKNCETKKGNISVSLFEPLAGIVPMAIADSDLLILIQIFFKQLFSYRRKPYKILNVFPGFILFDVRFNFDRLSFGIAS